jgi:fructoselysine 6-kinase
VKILRLLAVGDNCVDHYVELDRRFPGGNALNVAVYASRLPDVEADYVGVLGTDSLGAFMFNQIQAEGLDTSLLLRREGETAVTTILVRGGERVFADYHEGVQMNAALPRGSLPDIARYSLVHFTVWGFGREHARWMKESHGVKLSCDFSSQLDDPRTEIMPSLDYSFFSGDGLIRDGVDPDHKIQELKERTPGLVVMTLGEHGSLAYDGETLHRGEALPVEVADTLGAGDGYIAAFLCAKLRGEPTPEAILKGHEAARDICKRLGAWGG